jgi:hypothetical protein
MSLCLLLALGANATAQAPTKKTAAAPEEKVPALLAAKPLKADPKDDELRKLLKARYNDVLAEAQAYWKTDKAPGTSIINLDDPYGRYQRLVQAGLAVRETPAERVALLAQYVELTRQLEKETKKRVDEGRWEAPALHRARYERLDAEVQLVRAKREAAKAKGK